MSKIQGLNRLIKNLDEISHLNAAKAINYVSKELEREIKKEASTFSKTGVKHITSDELEKTRWGTSKAVGLFYDGNTWNEWRGLYFQHYGYFAHSNTGKLTDKYIDKHKNWFDNAIKKSEKRLVKELKEMLEDEIKRTFNR